MPDKSLVVIHGDESHTKSVDGCAKARAETETNDKNPVVVGDTNFWSEKDEGRIDGREPLRG